MLSCATLLALTNPAHKESAGRARGVNALPAGYRPCCRCLRLGTSSPASDLPGERLGRNSLVAFQGNPRSPASPAGLVTRRAACAVLPGVLSLRGAGETTHASSSGGTPGATGATSLYLHVSPSY